MKIFGAAIFASSVISVGMFFFGVAKPFVAVNNNEAVAPVENRSMPAAVFFTQSTTSSDLREAFDSVSSTKKKLNILIVPGHEPGYGGAEYLGVIERDLNAELSLQLAQYLVEDGHYNVVMTRGTDGWNPYLKDYFISNKNEIKEFTQSKKWDMARLISEGKITVKSDNLPHNTVPDEVALRLYGINRWANDHNVDIIIHVHFNDSSPRKASLPGEYNGFAIYTPEHQYSNSRASSEIAPMIFKRLSKMFSVSNLPTEDQGIVEDQDLIAVGSYNSVDAASMLIEYGYIYEPQFKTPSVRAAVLKELAFQTYLGLADFFGEAALIASPFQSTLLPYEGSGSINKTKSASLGALAVQAALIDKGFYPPEYYSHNECPLTGVFGSCTKTSLSAFQKQFGIKGEQGIVGAQTSAQLRKLFQSDLVGAR